MLRDDGLHAAGAAESHSAASRWLNDDVFILAERHGSVIKKARG